MIFIRFTPNSEEKAQVESFGIFTEQFPQDDPNVIFVEDDYKFPAYIEHTGKDGVLYINPSTKEMWYEYVDRPLTQEEKIYQLELEKNDLQIALAELGMSAEQDKIETQIAIAELAMLVTGGEA